MLSVGISIAFLLFAIGVILMLRPQNKKAFLLQQLNKSYSNQLHQWNKSQNTLYAYCVSCNSLTTKWLSEILQCQKCGVFIHKFCKYIKKAIPCKNITSNKNLHHWVQSIHYYNEKCICCNTMCSGMEFYVCIWCNRVKHALCEQNGLCDYGSLRKFIIEPTSIRYSSQKGLLSCFNQTNQASNLDPSQNKNSDVMNISIDRKNVRSEMNIEFDLSNQKKSPVVVLVNKKSGGQMGANLLKEFYRALNPIQVISILDQGLERLQIFAQLQGLILVVAGGDGTICSVLNYVKTIPQWKNVNPPVAILPLGTGNDLSQTLGWGSGADQPNANYFLQSINHAQEDLLDRWTMTIQKENQKQQLTIYNYIGFGLQAKICKQFHEIRQKYPNLFFSQFSNKLIYTQMGTMEYLKGEENLLENILKVRVDGKDVGVEELQNLLLLNIKHWGGGVSDLWKEKESYKKQSYYDGYMEVVGMSDIIQVGQVQVGIQQPFQLAQGSIIEIQSKLDNKELLIQADGQPIKIDCPVKIRIQRKDQVRMMTTASSPHSKMFTLLHKALRGNIITNEQLNAIMALQKNIY